MTAGSSRSRVRRAAMEWDVPSAAPTTDDVDPRLRAGAGRTGLLQVLIDHDTPGIGRCPRCAWAPTTSRRDCPSRVIAKSLLEGTPLPGWLAHLVDDIPGAKNAAQTREQQCAAQDAEPGLFAAPRRTGPSGGR